MGSESRTRGPLLKRFRAVRAADVTAKNLPVSAESARFTQVALLRSDAESRRSVATVYDVRASDNADFYVV